MSTDRWQRIEQLFHAALEQEPDKRGGFLLNACREDLALRREVESLLAQSGSTGALVDRSAWGEVCSANPETCSVSKPAGVLGPYRILKLLGEGGMGAVYAALDTRLDRNIAIKVCREEFSVRFEREARAISALNHPNICTLHDIGTLPSGLGYLVMELVEGDTLRDLLHRGLPAGRGLNIAKQVLEALAAAHRAGIVHRDLKPANIMVRTDGYVKVLDFGLSKQILPGTAVHTESIATLDISHPGQLLGTVGYMSPEQISGQVADARSDLFAFGIILYEMLAGQHPWPRRFAVDVLHAILHDDPPPMGHTSQLVAGLAPILQKLLCRNSMERYGSAEAVLEALANTPGDLDRPVAKPLTSIAVLPFAFLCDVEERKSLSLGFADAVITALAHLEDVVVTPTSTILKYAPGVEPAHVCRELGVRHTLQGSVQKAGAHWRVSIQLFDVAAQRITLSERYDFWMENVFEIQDEIGRRVVNALGSRATPDIPKSRDRYTSNPAAYNEFMAGLREGYSVRHETLESAVQHLSAAIEGDPEFALAHAWLSYVSMNIYYHFDTRPARVETAEWHYRRALEIDPALPEANLAKAFILWSPAKNFQHAEAIAALEQVLEARPNLEQAHNRMCTICMHIGRFEEAHLAFERAQRANPKNLQIPARHVAQIHLWSGDFTSAEKAGEAWIRESPSEPNAHWFYPQPPLMTGDLDLAEIRLNAGLKLCPDDPLISSLQAILHARRGEAASAIDCARRAMGVPLANGHFHHVYYQVACTYAVIGELHQTMAWLERSADTGFPCWPFFKLDPHLENVRKQPEFDKLVSGLERKWTALKIGGL